MLDTEISSLFRKVIVLVILSKKVYMYMWTVPNGFQDRAEYADMLYVYGFRNGSATATVDGFLCAEFWIIECFPRCTIHCMNVVRFPVLDVSSEWTCQQHVEEQENVLEMVQHSPTTSTQSLSTCLGVSRTCVWWTLHDDSLYSSHSTACAKSTPRGQCHAFRILTLVT
jgi:hypothetical protein